MNECLFCKVSTVTQVYRRDGPFRLPFAACMCVCVTSTLCTHASSVSISDGLQSACTHHDHTQTQTKVCECVCMRVHARTRHSCFIAFDLIACRPMGVTAFTTCMLTACCRIQPKHISMNRLPPSHCKTVPFTEQINACFVGLAPCIRHPDTKGGFLCARTQATRMQATTILHAHYAHVCGSTISTTCARVYVCA